MLTILQTCPLFAGIAAGDIESLLTCLGGVRRRYRRDAFLLRAGEPAPHVGIVLAGGVHVIQEDFWGNRMILARVEPGELFGEAFSCAEVAQLPISVVAAAVTDVLLLDCRKIIATCPSACGFHTRLVRNLLRILADKNLLLTRKMEHLSKRTTREKLLSLLSDRARNGVAVLPFTRQELADYLCVDRSALSRELGRMQQDGLIRVAGRRFELL